MSQEYSLAEQCLQGRRLIIAVGLVSKIENELLKFPPTLDLDFSKEIKLATYLKFDPEFQTIIQGLC